MKEQSKEIEISTDDIKKVFNVVKETVISVTGKCVSLLHKPKTRRREHFPLPPNYTQNVSLSTNMPTVKPSRKPYPPPNRLETTGFFKTKHEYACIKCGQTMPINRHGSRCISCTTIEKNQESKRLKELRHQYEADKLAEWVNTKTSINKVESVKVKRYIQYSKLLQAIAYKCHTEADRVNSFEGHARLHDLAEDLNKIASAIVDNAYLTK